MNLETWLIGALGLKPLVEAGGIFGKIVSAVHETEADFEQILAAGTSAAAVIEGVASNPTNVSGDLAAIPSAVADVKAALSAATAIVTTLKAAATTTTKAASVAVVTTAPITVPHPVTGAPITIPVVSTISVPVPASPESAAPLNFPPTDGSGNEDTLTPGVIQSPDFTPGGGPSE